MVWGPRIVDGAREVFLLVIPGLALGGENKQRERGEELTDLAQELSA